MGFWDRKIAQVRGQPLPPQQSQYHPSVPQQSQTMIPVQHQSQQQGPPPPVPGVGQINVMQAASLWRGREAAKQQEQCPECDSHNYGAVKAKNVSGGGTNLSHLPPVYMCFDCGWPKVQFGSPTGMGGDQQKIQGPQQGGGAYRARQPGSFYKGAQLKNVIARVKN